MKVVPLTGDLVDRVIPVHLEAFDGYPNALLGAPYVRAFLSWFVNAPAGIALVALGDDDEILGFVAGAPGHYGAQRNRDLRSVVVRQLLRRPWIVFHPRVAYALISRVKALLSRRGVQTTASQDAEATTSLVAIGTSRKSRRSGVAKVLVRSFEEVAASRGAKSLRLSVYAANVAARALYERSGWRLLTNDDHARVVYYGRDIQLDD